jgi:hypothetical protein
MLKKKDFKGIRKVFFKGIKKTESLLRAYKQTSAVMVIKAPKTAVNPKKTIR